MAQKDLLGEPQLWQPGPEGLRSDGSIGRRNHIKKQGIQKALAVNVGIIWSQAHTCVMSSAADFVCLFRVHLSKCGILASCGGNKSGDLANTQSLVAPLSGLQDVDPMLS